MFNVLVCIWYTADTDSDIEGRQPEKYALDIEEASLAISAGARLLTKLLDSKQFCQTINSTHFIKLLRKILKSNVPLHYKDWVAACLVKLSCLSGPDQDFENPINMEVTLYEAIPRLIEQIKSFSSEAREAAVIELNRIISEGVVDSTRAVASEGGIFPLVKLIEEGSNRAVEAGLAILYNLSMDSENHSAIIAAGAVPALRRIVLSQRPQWTRALRLLRNLPVWWYVQNTWMIRLQEEKSLVLFRQCVNDVNQIHFVLEPLYEFGLRYSRVMLFLRHCSFSIKKIVLFLEIRCNF